VLKAHRLLYHSTLGLRMIKKKEEGARPLVPAPSRPSTQATGCHPHQKSVSWGLLVKYFSDESVKYISRRRQTRGATQTSSSYFFFIILEPRVG